MMNNNKKDIRTLSPRSDAVIALLIDCFILVLLVSRDLRERARRGMRAQLHRMSS